MAESHTKQWKIFIPSQTLNCESGFIHGSIVADSHIVCIECIIARENLRQTSVIGIWKNTRKQYAGKVLKSNLNNSPWLELGISEFGSVTCNLKNPVHKKQKLKSHCILYDPCDLLSSYILTNKSFIHQSRCSGGKHELTVSCENVSTVVSCLLKFRKRPDENDTDETVDIHNNRKRSNIKSGGAFYSFCKFVLQPFILLFLLFGKLFDNRCTRNSYVEMCLDGPALTRQIRYRSNFLRNSLGQKDNSPMNRLRFLDSCGRQMVDSMLGLCVLVVMVNATLADTAAAGIMSWADNVVTSLTDLINWMMGAPAGLKLNSQLTHFLGHFFLYHIYLWTGYLSLLRPVLGLLLQCSSVLGVVGLSAQLCLVQDIISTMTVHIYCFYVYAARLYSLQVYALASLWRLFRGKKWNVLRHRVDSAVYDVDQLFVGTLFFTILLFLLPTTLLYYIFFLALRLVVLVSEGILAFCVRQINHLPIYCLSMWMLGSNTVAGDVLFSVVPRSHTDTSLILTMQTTQLPLNQLLKEVSMSPISPPPSDSLGTLIHKVIKGQLIYPWIDEVSKTDKKSS